MGETLDEKARRAAAEWLNVWDNDIANPHLTGSLTAAFKAFAEEAREKGADQEWKAVIAFLRSREYTEAAERIERGDHEEFRQGGGQG